MYTTLAFIKSCLNSLPLIPLTNDLFDYFNLTPAHFLTGDLLTNVPEPDRTIQPEKTLKKWHHIQRIQQHFGNAGKTSNYAICNSCISVTRQSQTHKKE